jgi:hypothetical protein
VRDLQALAGRIGRPLLAADLEDQPRLRAAIRQHFGRFQSALKAAGLPSPVARQKWSLARVINELRRLHREGIKLTEPGLKTAGRSDLSEAARVYAGTLTAARKLARVPGPPRLSKARIIAEIRASDGQPLSKRLQQACRNYFGSIRAAAGMPSKMKVWSKDAIVEELRQRAARGERMRDLNDPCRRHFGSISAAHQAAGLPSLRRWKRAEVLEAVRRHHQLYGTALPRLLARACRVHVGSVAAARAAAGVGPVRETRSKRTSSSAE